MSLPVSMIFWLDFDIVLVIWFFFFAYASRVCKSVIIDVSTNVIMYRTVVKSVISMLNGTGHVIIFFGIHFVR